MKVNGPGKVELDKKAIHGSGKSMRGYILTYSWLEREKICQLWDLTTGDPHFCIHSTPLHGRGGGKKKKRIFFFFFFKLGGKQM